MRPDRYQLRFLLVIPRISILKHSASPHTIPDLRSRRVYLKKRYFGNLGNLFVWPAGATTVSDHSATSWKSRSLSTLNRSRSRLQSGLLRHLPPFQLRRPSPHTPLQTAPSPPSPPIPPPPQPRPMLARPFQHHPVVMDTFAPLEPSSPSPLDTVTVS